MEQVEKEKTNRVLRFLSSPLRSKYPAPMTHVGDYFAAAGLVIFCVSVFGLKWITVSVKDVLGIGQALGVKGPHASYGLFVSPWAWGMVAVLVIAVGGMWFVQARGIVTLGVGAYCLLFNLIFFIGVWHKINAIIGNIVKIVSSAPVIGQMLGQVVNTLAKELLSVHVAVGYWLFIPAGLLLVTGGALRLASRPRALASEGEAE